MATMPRSFFAFCLAFVRKHWLGYFGIVLLRIFWGFFQIGNPYLIKVLTDTISSCHVNRQEIFSSIRFPLLSWMGLWVAFILSERALGLLRMFVITRMRAEIRQDILQHMVHHSYHYFTSHLSGTITNKATRFPQNVVHIVGGSAIEFFSLVLVLCNTLFILWMTYPGFTLIASVWLVVHMGITFFFARTCALYSADHANAISNLYGEMGDILSNIMSVRSFSRQKHECTYIVPFQEEEVTKARIASAYIEKFNLFQGLANLVSTFCMTLLAVYEWSKGAISVGDLILIIMLCMNLMWFLNWLGGLLSHFFEDLGSAREAFSLLATSHDIVDEQSATPIDIAKGDITIKNLHFAYDNTKAVFEDISLHIRSGEKVGLVGFSGSGKSTLIHLLLRDYAVLPGSIFIDGQDINTITQESLRAQIAVVPQDVALFHRSLLENIRYGKLEASDNDVIVAAKKAHCHEFIMDMPQGYHALVGERGTRLSGGQRQRMAVARAILKDAPILIMDEATSSLDSITEHYIQESLNSLMQGRTTIVIAHRLSTLSHIDRIIVFNEGKIVEEGNHAELLAKSGYYAHLWNMQVNGFLTPNEQEEFEQIEPKENLSSQKKEKKL